MAKKTIFFCVLLAYCCVSAMWAAGRKENESREANAPGGFADSIDVSGKKSGKYSFYFEAKDKSDNAAIAGPGNIYIDPASDLPEASIINPVRNMRVDGNINIMGIAVDDDGVAYVELSIKRGKGKKAEEVLRTRVESAKYWSYFLDTADGSVWMDGPYSVTAWAVDVNGLSGISEAFKPRQHKVHEVFWTLERKRPETPEPRAAVVNPAFGSIQNGVIEINGTSYAESGIDRLQISLDNGNTFNTVNGTDRWNYRFNTKTLQDGPHVILIRAWDKYGISSTYSSMVIVDNTLPEVIMDYPEDGFISMRKIPIIGQVNDPNLTEISIEVRNLDGVALARELRSRKLEITTPVTIIKETLDLSNQPEGVYNVEILATDTAGNSARHSRNVVLSRDQMKNFVEILYPLDNEIVQGTFNLYGYTGGLDKASSVTIKINGADITTSDVEESGYFRFSLDSSLLVDGLNRIVVWSYAGFETAESLARNIVYRANGPWVTIDSMISGDLAIERPYLAGRTGYSLSAADQAILDDNRADKYSRTLVQAKAWDFTELSFDNGKTFVKASKSASKDIDFRYRLETSEMDEGMHYIIVRSTMKNGETAVTKMLVQVDKTSPTIRVISPEEGKRYNEEIPYSATAEDDVELVSLTYHLRAGDKAAYEVPKILQGLYFEGVLPPLIKQFVSKAPVMPFGGGATYADFGMGLSFFDDNVKIQFQYGFMFDKQWKALGGDKEMRYGGHVLGLKLLATVYTLPFGSFGGPDWEWLFASFALGANFSLFDAGREGYTQSGVPTWMSALVAQIEFPKISIPKKKFLRTFSMFTEGQLWFVPTDVPAEKNGLEVVIPHVVIGLRLYIF